MNRSALLATQQAASWSALLVGIYTCTIVSLSSVSQAIGSETAAPSSWPHLLGPQYNSSLSTGMAIQPAAVKLQTAWHIPAGTGYTTPVVSKDRVLFFHRREQHDVLTCLDLASGRQLWEQSAPSSYKDRFGYNNGPRSSPSVHQGRVLVRHADGRLAAYALDKGDLLWKRDLHTEFSIPPAYFGVGSSPLLVNHVAVVQLGANNTAVLGLDLATGEDRWRSRHAWGDSYASPIPIKQGKRQYIAVLTGGPSNPPSGGLLILDAMDGRVVSEAAWRSTLRHSVNAASPLAIDGGVLVTASYQTGSIMFDLDNGQLRERWRISAGSHWASPLPSSDGSLVFLVDGRHAREATLVAVDVASGEVVWRERPSWATAAGQERGLGRTGLTGLGRHCVTLTESGDLLWMELNRTGLQISARQTLFDAKETWSRPVIVGKQLLVVQRRTSKVDAQMGPALRCYSLK